jgi:hypothetical protein
MALLLAACGDDGGADGSVDTGPTDAGPDADALVDTGPYVPPPPPPPPPSEPGLHDVEVIDTRQIVPGDGLPPEVVPQDANNNLDVVRHADGRVYLAFRTAPTHFADEDVQMHVVSSGDEVTWDYETTFDLGHDLREPRFLSLGDTLFLYVARLGSTPTAFEPQGTSYASRAADGTWSDLAPLSDLGEGSFIVWRTKMERGTPYMIVYEGGENIYTDGEPLNIELRTTADGITWTALNPMRPVISTGGGSETDFALSDGGDLFGIIRNEAGDELGWGSKVCSAPASDITDWTCVGDPKKYDSPLMFWHDGEAYLVGRRNVTETGNYDVMSERGDRLAMTFENQFQYVTAPKRCSLWRWVQGENRIAYILDLPSAGDTCFPGRLLGESPDEIVIYNYSSDPEGPDYAWNQGQIHPTNIYRHVLRFTRR